MGEWWILRFGEEGAPEEDWLGVGESKYEFPFLFKVLLSVDTRLVRCDDAIGSDRVVGLEGRTDGGLDRVESFLDQLDMPELEPAIGRTIEKLRVAAAGRPMTRALYTLLSEEDDPYGVRYCTELLDDIEQWRVEGARIERYASAPGQRETRIRDTIVELGLHNFEGAPPRPARATTATTDDGFIPGRPPKDSTHEATLRNLQSAVSAEAHHRSTRSSTSIESEDRDLEQILELRRGCKAAVLKLGRSQVASRVSDDAELQEKVSCFARVFDIGLAQQLNVLSAFDIALVAATDTDAELAATAARIRSRMVDGDRSRMQEIYTKQTAFIELLMSEPSWRHHVEPPADAR